MSDTTAVELWYAEFDPNRLELGLTDDPYLRDLELQFRGTHARFGDRVWLPRSLDPNNEVGLGTYDYYQHGQSQGAIFPLPDGTYRITSYLTDQELGFAGDSSAAAKILEQHTKRHRVRRILRSMISSTWDS